MPTLRHDADTTPPAGAPHPLVRAAQVFGAWSAFGLLMAQQAALNARVRGETRGWLETLGPAMLGAWIWTAYTPVVVPVARWLRRARERGWRGWLLAGVVHPALALVLTAVDAVVYAWLRPYIDGTQSTIPRVFAAVILLDVLLYAVVVTLVEMAAYATAYRERDRAASALARTAAELQGKLDEARLHALESQLRPHFLYNTLNLIAELVHDEPDAADEMLTRLGFLLRRACREGAHLVPLGEELAVVRAYGEILARRYRDRVTLTLDVPTALHDHLVPAFSLQPLVENAFRHGVERRERGTAVDVAAAEEGDALVLRVVDRGVGAETRGARTRRRNGRARAWAGDPPGTDARGGVGLRNTRERLAALFGPRAGLTLDHADDVAIATLWLPTRTTAATSPALAEGAVAAPALTLAGG
ncbi:MAG: histidine kinase [Gemmatirosa sp.]|nr:histidine kinase [Gemmatirosa sp.]